MHSIVITDNTRLETSKLLRNQVLVIPTIKRNDNFMT